mgnify:CR=1 FL=1
MVYIYNNNIFRYRFFLPGKRKCERESEEGRMRGGIEREKEIFKKQLPEKEGGG